MIVYFEDDIKKLNRTIVYIEIPKTKAKEQEDIQLIKDAKVDKLTLTIIHQAYYKYDDFDENLEESKQ